MTNANAGAAALNDGGTGGAPAGGAPAGGAANGNWFDPIQNADVKTWVQAKGFKDPIAAAESAYNLEKLIGFDKAGRTIVMPKEDATPEERRAFLTKLGAPEKAEGYELKVPQGGDDKFAKTAATWFHEAGLNKTQAAMLAEKWNEFNGSQTTATLEARAQQSEVDMQGLKTEWGQGYDKNIEHARRAAKSFIPSASDAERSQLMTKIENAIGTAAMLKMFAKIGGGLGEHAMQDGSGGSGGGMFLTPAEAKAKIEALKSDKDWTSKYLSGDKKALAEMERLSKLAVGSPA